MNGTPIGQPNPIIEGRKIGCRNCRGTGAVCRACGDPLAKCGCAIFLAALCDCVELPRNADPTDRAESFILRFGKHSGFNLFIVAFLDPGYIEWLRQHDNPAIKRHAQTISLRFQTRHAAQMLRLRIAR